MASSRGTWVRWLWMRGFLPAALFLLLWAVSSGLWIIWQGRGPTPPRALLGRGVVMVNWSAPWSQIGFGTPTWFLGVLNQVNGQPVTWLVDSPLWSWQRARIEWRPVVRNGHVQLPLYLVAILAAVPPAAVAGWRARQRSRQLPFPHCQKCRYDLRGVSSSTCPECGTPIAKA